MKFSSSQERWRPLDTRLVLYGLFKMEHGYDEQRPFFLLDISELDLRWRTWYLDLRILVHEPCCGFVGRTARLKVDRSRVTPLVLPSAEMNPVSAPAPAGSQITQEICWPGQDP